jgi:hypothetical protein
MRIFLISLGTLNFSHTSQMVSQLQLPRKLPAVAVDPMSGYRQLVP